MNALHIGPTPFFSDRGCHVRIRGLMRALDRLGVESTLCTYHHGRDVDGIETLRSLRIPWYTRVAAGPSPWKYLADLFLFFRVCRAVYTRRPDVIHGHLHEGALIGWAARLVFFWRRIPVVFDMQGSLVGELAAHDYVKKKGGLKRRLFAWIERFIDHRPQRVVCSSEHSLAIARDEFGVPASRLSVVADGVDAGRPDAAAAKRLRKDLALPDDRPVAVYTGSLLRVKGVRQLHELILGLARRDARVHFLLVGYPTEETEAYLKEHGIEDACTLTGRADYDRLPEYLALADIAIDPKAGDSGEASGKLLNYMAAGLPVACFGTPNNRGMVGDAGCYAEDGSVEALADGVLALAADPERRASLGGKARARAAERYSWDASARALLDVYRGLKRSRK